MTVDDLMRQIQETERLIAVYRDANEVIVGTEDQIYARRGVVNRTTLPAAEIGDQIVRILERRVYELDIEVGCSRAVGPRPPPAAQIDTLPTPLST